MLDLTWVQEWPDHENSLRNGDASHPFCHWFVVTVHADTYPRLIASTSIWISHSF